MGLSAANLPVIVALGGFLLGAVFGSTANRTNFCTMGAVSDIVNMGHWGRMRMWLLAIAIAVIGANALDLAGLVDLSKSFYNRPVVPWVSLILGGFLFGIGMTLGSGCASKTLVRMGGGSLKSVVVFVFLGIAAYMTLKGLFAIWRTRWIDPLATDFGAMKIPSQDLPTLFSSFTGANPAYTQVAIAGLLAGALIVFVFMNREFRASADHVVGGIVVGLVVVAGWYLTGHLGFAENPETLENTYFGTNSRTLESLSFTAPVAFALELLMLWSDKSLTVTFGIAATAGIVAGSAAYALASRSFRWEGFVSAEDTAQHIIGGILMGFGGVLAVGCTIGQGLSGISTLAVGSFLAFAAIVAGSALTLKWQYWRMMREA